MLAQWCPNGIVYVYNFYYWTFQARRKWEEEQESFDRRRREHEMKMVEMERAEVVRREEEIRFNFFYLKR